MQSDSGGATNRARTAAELAAEIERQINVGTLAPGDRLDPVRTAADALGLAPNTVAAAYRQLGERGLVTGEGRRGTFVSNRGPVEEPVVPPVADGLTNLADGNPDLALLPDLEQAVSAIATNHVRYGESPIDARLAQAFATNLAPDLPGAGAGAEIEAGRDLAVVSGALDGIERVLATRLRPGDRVAVEDPGYAAVFALVKVLGFRPVPVPVDPQGLEPQGLAGALADGVQAVIVTPRAQNPTGAAIGADRAAVLSELLAAHPDVLIIEDDHAGPVAGAPYHGVIGPQAERWAVIRSVAKSLGPDLRVAALAGDSTTVARVARRQLVGAGWVSHLLQRTVAELLNPSGPGLSAEERFARAAAAYRQRRNRLLAGLAEHQIEATGPSGLNVWVPVSDEAAVVTGLQDHGFAVRPGARFRLNSPPAIRISVGSASLDELDGVAAALGAVLGRGRGVRGDGGRGDGGWGDGSWGDSGRAV